ncbi:MAG: C40 family peptidase [Bacteroidia bacterium]|nr:C40 family peptidase [Bacteroidia bacterium]MDW8235504.1 C40 family peptidase [Bacteroidia bacterium]
MGEWVWIPAQAVVPLRAEPTHRSEMVSTLLWGEPQQILLQERDWLQVRGWIDGYVGWVPTGALMPAYLPEREWGIVFRREAPLYHEEQKWGWVPCGSLVPTGGYWHTAQGRFWVPSGYWRPWRKRSLQPLLRKWQGLFHRTPYLWGGKSPHGIDCSGLTQLFYRLAGKILPRNAYQQADFTLPTTHPQPGDLVFFTPGDARITHVGLWLNDGYLLHATPAAGVQVQKVDSLFTHVLHSIRTFFHEDFVI